MTIVRNGVEIELTGMEEVEVYRKVKREYLIEDLKAKAKEMEYDPNDFTDEEWERFADHAEKTIGNNDSLWESYWMSIEYALEHI